MGRYTFITDDEFEALLGVQVVEATRMLRRYAENVCWACGGECCETVGCGFYNDEMEHSLAKARLVGLAQQCKSRA